MSDSEDDSSGVETRGKMLQRHKREVKDLKAQTAKLGKKKKDEIAAMEAALKKRHEEELKSLETGGPPKDALAELEAQMAALKPKVHDEEAEGEEGGGGKMSKAAKKRQAKAAADAEREARIAAENEAMGDSERLLEHQAITGALLEAGLRMKEIQPDGHCMYRSVSHQLGVLMVPEREEGAWEVDTLRELTGKWMREHPDDFQPFIEGEFDTYVTKIESTAEWGGQLELQALAHTLQLPIKVHSVGMPDVAFGEEYAGKSEGKCVHLAYLKHAFGLGEHYNSTTPLPTSRGAEAGSDEE